MNNDNPTQSDPPPSANSPAGAASRPAGPSRTVLALVGVVLLLVGVGIGLLIHALLPEEQSSDVPAANSAAVGFAQDMTRHHEQGTEMASIELNRGEDPDVRSMAFDILLVQTNEIGQMQSWLTRWGYPLINTGEPMQWMEMDHSGSGSGHGDHGDHGEMSDDHDPSGAPTDADTPAMPGMATQAEMDRFRAMSGAEADVYFLQLMLRHHEGGLHMMDYAADEANVDQEYVRALATGMRSTQDREIAVIKQMLAARGAQPLPMN